MAPKAPKSQNQISQRLSLHPLCLNQSQTLNLILKVMKIQKSKGRERKKKVRRVWMSKRSHEIL